MSEAKQFIDLLESQGLIDKEVIAELRRQLAESKGRVTPEAVAKVLVENGQLTRFQATKLIASLRDDQPTAGSEKPPVRSESKDDLDLIPDDLLAEPRRSGSDKTPPAAVLIEEESVAPQEEPSQKVVLPKKSKRKASRAPAPVDDAFTTALPRATTKLPVAKKNNWDQFRIYGFLSILLLLLVPLAGLGYWMWKGSSSDWLDMSKKAYEGRDYELAQARYSEFLKRFPSDENASLARVRIGLSKIRHAAERSTDPAEALKVSKETLPTLVEESALTAERPDLASALLTIAEKFNQKADNAKAIDEKKSLVGGLEEHLTLIQNPQYVGTQERNQNEARIKRIEESRDRIVRDIKRSEDLVATVAAMKESLAKQEVDMAYAARRALVRNYPQLETEPQIVELVAEATRIQQSLVGSSTVQVQSTANPPSAVPALPNAILANRRGGAVAAEVDGTVVVRAKDAAYGLDARSGDVKWRKYLGSQWQGDPLRVAKELESDWIANFPEQGLVRRMQTADGSALWEASLGGPVLSPMVDRDDLFVASRDGKLCALDLQTGMSRWGKQLPQPVDVSPGFYGGREFGYVLGNHSNLYVVSRRSGACDEVFYLGHREGSVKVPPVYALGHVLIFENEGPGYCLIRVLKCDDQGKNLTPGQPSIRLRGHVVVPAQVEGRRVVLVTDLGEVVILDIEPSNATDQVTKLASRVASETQPRDLWPLLDKNELWLTGRNFTRLKVVVSKQLLDPEWVKEDQDQFTGPAQRLGPLVVHSRILRGTRGVRVAAVDGVSGEMAWEVDLGTPVSALLPGDQGFPMRAVTSQAADYRVEADDLASGRASKMVENAGRNERSLLFRSPVDAGDGRWVMLNESQGNQMIVAETSGGAAAPLRRVAMALGGAVATGTPVPVGGNLLLLLSNGQIAMVDPGTGETKAQPFQPPLDPQGGQAWTGAVLMPDKQTVVVADNKQRLYRLATGNAIRSLQEVTTERPLTGPWIGVGSSVVGVASGPTGDLLEFYQGADLSKGASLQLSGRVAWGPYAIPGGLLVWTDGEGLVAVDEAGARRWSTPLPSASLVGPPVAQGGLWWISSAAGRLYGVKDSDGSAVTPVEIGEPLSYAPAVAGGRVLVPGDQGVVIEVPADQLPGGGS